MLDCALLTEVFLTSKAVWKANMREVHASGEAPELDRMVARDDRLKQMRWFPSIVSLIGKFLRLTPLGKQWFREETLANRAYTCEDADGELHYVEAASSEGCTTPSVKSYRPERDAEVDQPHEQVPEVDS